MPHNEMKKAPPTLKNATNVLHASLSLESERITYMKNNTALNEVIKVNSTFSSSVKTLHEDIIELV